MKKKKKKKNSPFSIALTIIIRRPLILGLIQFKSIRQILIHPCLCSNIRKRDHGLGQSYIDLGSGNGKNPKEAKWRYGWWMMDLLRFHWFWDIKREGRGVSVSVSFNRHFCFLFSAFTCWWRGVESTRGSRKSQAFFFVFSSTFLHFFKVQKYSGRSGGFGCSAGIRIGQPVAPVPVCCWSKPRDRKRSPNPLSKIQNVGGRDDPNLSSSSFIQF